MSSKIYVGNLSRDIREDDIKDAFEKYGDVDKVFLKEGFAFVHMMDDRDAADAIKELDGRRIGDSDNVRVEKPRDSRGDRGGRGGGDRGGGGGCYNCGRSGHFARDCRDGGGSRGGGGGGGGGDRRGGGGGGGGCYNCGGSGHFARECTDGGGRSGGGGRYRSRSRSPYSRSDRR